MHRSTRSKAIDYKKFNSTGIKVFKNQESGHLDEVSQLSKSFENLTMASSKSSTMDMTDDPTSQSFKTDHLTCNVPDGEIGESSIRMKQFEESNIADEIDDFIEENITEYIENDMEEIEKCILKLEQFRQQYRSLHREVTFHIKIEEHEEEVYQERIKLLKKCLLDLKQLRSNCRRRDADNKTEDQEAKFLVSKVRRSIELCRSIHSSDLHNVKDGVIIQKQEEMKQHMPTIQQLSTMMQQLIKCKVQKEDMKGEVSRIIKEYDIFEEQHQSYHNRLTEEARSREVEKYHTFKHSSLNIKLEKFQGYNATKDIYTFKSEFEKLHLNSTPKRLLPDLLKNNFLSSQAYSLVQSVDDIEEIWSRLTTAYGDPRSILTTKMKSIGKLEPMWRLKQPEKTADGLAKIINLMKDLMKLSKEHNIENQLFYGDALNQIYKLLGDGRVTRWLETICDEQLVEKALWEKLVLFLDKEMKIQQQRVLILLPKINNESKEKKPANLHVVETKEINDSKCFICGGKDHIKTTGPGGTQLIQYFTCQKFVEMSPAERYETVQRKGFCIQCLYPGAKANHGKHKYGNCQRDFVCPHSSHEYYQQRKHILLCDEHKTDERNNQVLQNYKSRCILRNKSIDNLPSYSKDIKLTFLGNTDSDKSTCQNSSSYGSNDLEHGLYLFQTIKVDNQDYRIFFDSGCGDFVSRWQAVQNLGERAHQEQCGPIKIGGVGGLSADSPYGIYSVSLPLYDGSEALLSGVCLAKITDDFPCYPLKGRVEKDIHNAYSESGGNIATLPKLPEKVGGKIDFIIGIKYLRYHPKKIFEMPSGLTVYESVFKSHDGTRGVVGGPHKVFSEIERYYHTTTGKTSDFLSNQLQLFHIGYKIDPDISILGNKSARRFADVEEELQEHIRSSKDFHIKRRIKKFNMIEDTGTEISYRCIKCRSCSTCKNHDKMEILSIKEEMEQDIINESVTINYNDHIAVASLPFIHSPKQKLIPNRYKAEKVLKQQIKKLVNKPKDKDQVIKSEAKLQQLGHVDVVSNLSSQDQEMLANSPIQNFIPWRVVWKENSRTTPCRLVFDASQPTDSGYSLNDIIAKGRNSMNKLQEIFIRWMIHRCAFHTDISKMYNTIQLKKEDWVFQRYLWKEGLNPEAKCQEKVIKTLVYGVRSSGNQAERALRMTAELSKDNDPRIHDIISKDIYVDDCLSGATSKNEVFKLADKLEVTLNKAGFSLKGITMSGKDPPELLTEDGESIFVAGMKWLAKEDLLQFDFSNLNFSKKIRGRKIHQEGIPSILTRRHCVSKVAEIYDLAGKLTPLTAGLKIDLHNLVKLNIHWDDAIPDNLKPLWLSNFQMLQEIKNLKFRRAIVPDDAVNLNMETLEFGDSSQEMACAAVYVRFQRKNGTFSSQLVFARSKTVPENLSQPRAELFAAVLNTYTAEVVKRAFTGYHQKSIKFTDSQIVLHWLHNEEKPLKQWVRNRVIEIRRFTSIEDWFYIDTSNMLADIGTRKGCSIEDVDENSVWMQGLEWMKGDKGLFPMKSKDQITLTAGQISSIKNETSLQQTNCHQVSANDSKNKVSAEVMEYYMYSKYVIDPCKFKFSKVIRILALIYRFIKKLQTKTKNQNQKKVVNQQNSEKLSIKQFITNQEIKKAEDYYFRKATLEIKHFIKESLFQKISKEKDGVLYYTGRILPTSEVTAAGKMTATMLDLSAITFCIPLISSNSPVAYSLVNEVHWYDEVKHSGIETTLRYVLKKAFVINGRELVKKIKNNCQRCRYLMKKTIDISMGPVSNHNLMIAPAFYVTQVDICGPFKAFSNFHKRTTIKIWLLVFCCCTTSAIKIKLMEDYSTSSFLLAFSRFSCESGYPKILLVDGGCQLLNGCENMLLDFYDIKFKLNQNVKVQFEVCPVGAHNMHGRVERKIREIKRSLEKSYHNERLSIIQWETVATEIANTINNLPIALGSISSDFEVMDLITPNRLLMGRNNERSPQGCLKVSNNYDKMIYHNNKIHECWFENWLTSHVPKLMFQPKWFNSSHDVRVGDIVLFIKHDSQLSKAYHYGKIMDVEYGKDGIVRKINVKYRNWNENVDRITKRCARDVVVIHHVDEIDILEELGSIAAQVESHFKLNDSN